MEVEAWLKEARLEQLGQLLDGLGVECLEDSPCRSVREEDLRDVKKIPLRRFLEKQKALMALLKPTTSLGESTVDTSPSSPVSSVEQEQDITFDWSVLEGEEADDSNLLDSWEFFETSMTDADSQLEAQKAATIEVPHFTFDALNAPKLQGNQKVSARPILWKLPPEKGWKFLTLQFPGGKNEKASLDSLKMLVEKYHRGFPYEERMYFYASSSSLDELSIFLGILGSITGSRCKANYPQGPTAWLASPPSGGPEQIDEHLGFGTTLVLTGPTPEIPFPAFRLRARVKQFFSSVIASIDTDSIQIVVVEDFTAVEPPVIRDDGAGEADPDILAALASAWGPLQEDVGRCRTVAQSAQIRCAGLKGMLIGSRRLQGTRRVEVPRSMLKFGTESFAGEHLHVLNFSKIRPTSLGCGTILRLEACGCDTSVVVEEHARYLKKIGNCEMSREDAVDCLRFAQQAADEQQADENDQRPSTQTGGMRFLGTFLKMLQSGFSPQQHPLLEVILRQKRRSLEQAKRQFHVRGCWSARGHPEPQDDRLELKDAEVFLMVPADGEETAMVMA
eukprot:Skav227221  [mRNA]  locus=scaffold2048:466673:468728:- [translate_table: standard]